MLRNCKYQVRTPGGSRDQNRTRSPPPALLHILANIGTLAQILYPSPIVAACWGGRCFQELRSRGRLMRRVWGLTMALRPGVVAAQSSVQTPAACERLASLSMPNTTI